MTEDPTFKHIFGKDWDNLPPVMHQHYANRPFSNDLNLCHGRMTIKSAFFLRLLSPLFKVFGGIPTKNANDVPVTVRFESNERDATFHFVRTFNFPSEKPYVFHSYMVGLMGNNVVEIMKYRLCWRSKFSWESDKVILAHNGFSLNLFGKFIPLPITWVIGHIHAEEEAISDTRFKMFVEINHWLFGKIYEYSGEFEMENTRA